MPILVPLFGVAYLRRKSTSPYWFACFPSPDGTRWLQRSTKTTDKAQATRFALEWERASKRGITEGQARRVLSDIHELIHDEPLSSASVKEYADSWLARKKVETKPGSFPTYSDAAREFLKFLRTKAASPLAFITPQVVTQFRDSVAAKSSAASANKKLKVLRGMFTAAWREGFISENPAAKVETLHHVAAVRRPFTLDELKRLLAVADTEWRGLILAGLYTGQRLGDLARLTWAQIDLAQSEIVFQTGKTGRTVRLPIAGPLADYLTELPSPEKPAAPVFPNALAKIQLAGRVGHLSNQFADLLVNAGLMTDRASEDAVASAAKGAKRSHAKKKDGKGRSASRQSSPLSFHCLRHTATSLLKNAGVPEAVARDIIGHESAAISRNYTHVDDVAKRSAVAKLPDVTA